MPVQTINPGYTHSTKKKEARGAAAGSTKCADSVWWWLRRY